MSGFNANQKLYVFDFQPSIFPVVFQGLVIIFIARKISIKSSQIFAGPVENVEKQVVSLYDPVESCGKLFFGWILPS
jgi:hypothetical protein